MRGEYGIELRYLGFLVILLKELKSQEKIYLSSIGEDVLMNSTLARLEAFILVRGVM